MLRHMPRAKSTSLPSLAEAPPHYHGHRERLRARFREAGADALADYELLELLLFRAIPRRDVKPLAKALLDAVRLVRRGDRGAAGRGSRKSTGIGEAAITELKIVAGGGAAACARAGEEAPGAVVLVVGARLLPHRAWRSPRRSSSASCSSTSATS